jgi:hypothetical protein
MEYLMNAAAGWFESFAGVLSRDADGDYMADGREWVIIVEIYRRVAEWIASIKCTNVRDSVKRNTHRDAQLNCRNVDIGDLRRSNFVCKCKALQQQDIKLNTKEGKKIKAKEQNMSPVQWWGARLEGEGSIRERRIRWFRERRDIRRSPRPHISQLSPIALQLFPFPFVPIQRLADFNADGKRIWRK